jgi:MYXO-CTERM domain-containing protein
VALLGVNAHANGRFPRAQQVVVQPGEAPRTTAIRTTFGIVMSDDARATFRFFCEEAFQYLDGQDPSIIVSPGGALLLGLNDGLVLFPPDRCSPERVPAFETQSVVDLASDPTGHIVFAAMTSSDPIPVSRVARSDDGGRTFVMPASGISNERLQTVEVAPSNASRVYASGYVYSNGRDVLLRSDDGGATFEHTMAFIEGTAGWYISAVDPQRPDVLYLRAELAVTSSDPDAGDSRASVLLRSDDAGDHFVEIGRTRGPMRGFAMSDDGRTLWIGGPADGISRSDDGAPFVHVSDVSAECMRFDHGELLVCETFDVGGILLGRSLDRGATVESVVRYSELQGPPTCPHGTIIGDICPSRWSRTRSIIDPLGSTMDAGFDASPIEPITAPPPTCNCRAAGGGDGARGGWGIAIVAGALSRSRRRRSGRGTRGGTFTG